jgi:hypothetical protein
LYGIIEIIEKIEALYSISTCAVLEWHTAPVIIIVECISQY